MPTIRQTLAALTAIVLAAILVAGCSTPDYEPVGATQADAPTLALFADKHQDAGIATIYVTAETVVFFEIVPRGEVSPGCYLVFGGLPFGCARPEAESVVLVPGEYYVRLQSSAEPATPDVVEVRIWGEVNGFVGDVPAAKGVR
jgi:hypothetical protein